MVFPFADEHGVSYDRIVIVIRARTGINDIMRALLHRVDPLAANKEASVQGDSAFEDGRVEGVRESARHRGWGGLFVSSARRRIVLIRLPWNARHLIEQKNFICHRQQRRRLSELGTTTAALL